MALVAEELGLELDGLKVATAVAAGNKAVGIEGEGPLGAQMQRLLKELGLGKAREEAEAKAEEEAVVAEEEGAENEAAKQAREEAVEAADDEVVVVAEENVQKGRKALLLDDVGPLLDARQELLQALGALDAKGKAQEKAPEEAQEKAPEAQKEAKEAEEAEEEKEEAEEGKEAKEAKEEAEKEAEEKVVAVADNGPAKETPRPKGTKPKPKAKSKKEAKKQAKKQAKAEAKKQAEEEAAEAAKAEAEAEAAEAAAAAEAEAEAERLRKEHEAGVDKAEVMERLLGKLAPRVALRLKEPEAFEARVQAGGAAGHAMLAAKGKDANKVKKV